MMQLLIGDLVNLPGHHHSMTIYDFEVGFTVALCNWVVGTKMYKLKVPVSQLHKMER